MDPIDSKCNRSRCEFSEVLKDYNNNDNVPTGIIEFQHNEQSQFHDELVMWTVEINRSTHSRWNQGTEVKRV